MSNYIIVCRRCEFKLPDTAPDVPLHRSEIMVQSDGEAVAAGWQRRTIGPYAISRHAEYTLGWVCPECVAELDSQVAT